MPLLTIVLFLVVGASSQAQNWPERQGFVQYSQEPDRIDIQGHIVVPVGADSVELRTARMLHRYFPDYIIIEDPVHSDSLYSRFNPNYSQQMPAIFCRQDTTGQ